VWFKPANPTSNAPRSTRAGKGAVLPVALAISAGLAVPLSAQQNSLEPTVGITTQPEGPFEGRFVSSVILIVAQPGKTEFLPPDRATDQLVRNQIRTGKGSREYSERIAADDIVRLNRLGRFQSVEQLIAEHDDGTITVTFRLQMQPIISDVQVTGNRRIKSNKLSEAIEFLAGTPVDQFELDRAARAIEDLYRNQGFYLVGVNVNLDELLETGIVLFEVREGLRTKITDIRFDGNSSFKNSELNREIKTRVAGIFERGPLDETQLRADERALARYYKDNGYLDARIGSLVQSSPDSREAIVTFYVEEGPLYSLNSIIIQYADEAETGPIMSAEQAVGLVEMKPGDTYSNRKVEDAVEKIKSAYGQMGYVDVRVQRQEARDPQDPLVDLVIGINQGQRFRLGLVNIKGNGTTRHEEIRKFLQVAPDRPLDSPAVERTRSLLASSRLFDTSNSPPRTAILRPDSESPRYRDLLVEVKEHNTGSFGFGAAVNSDNGLNGRISFTQRNFDVTDTPDSLGDFFSGKSFRGGGQTFSIVATPGTSLGEYSISLGDNSINDSTVGGSISANIRTRDYDEFDEDRRGVNGAITRRFGQRWRGSIDARFQSVDLSDITPESSTDLFDVEGKNEIVGLGFGLRRTTVPAQDRFRPTSGSIMQFGVEQVGLIGGDFDFTKLSAEHTVFLALSEDSLNRKTVLRLNTHVRYIPQGQDEVPTYERYHLGGKSMRGLAHRTVGPRGLRNDNGMPSDDPIGGTWSFYWGAELQQPLAGDSLALAFFMDTGTVGEEFSFDDYRVTVGTGIRLFVPQLSPAPLAFDFGFPVLKEDTDENRLFTFDVDVPF
jgi:outer membrane protein insertion porin family